MIIRIVHVVSFIFVAILFLVMLSAWIAPAGKYEVMIWSVLVIVGVVFIVRRPRSSSKSKLNPR